LRAVVGAQAVSRRTDPQDLRSDRQLQDDTPTSLVQARVVPEHFAWLSRDRDHVKRDLTDPRRIPVWTWYPEYSFGLVGMVVPEGLLHFSPVIPSHQRLGGTLLAAWILSIKIRSKSSDVSMEGRLK
jgi:hypothetical protein